MAITKSTNENIIKFSAEVKKEQQLPSEDLKKIKNDNSIIITEPNTNDIKKIKATS